MIRHTVRPNLDPVAHKATIDALEAQRAAYRRFARDVAGQRERLSDGDGEGAVTVGADATRGFAELEDGARRLEPMMRELRESGSAEQLQEIERRMEALVRDARQAETAIQNLSLQLEAWRDAYGRQLAELGFTPGAVQGEPGDGSANGGAHSAGGVPQRGPYVQPGFGRHAGVARPTLIDKKG